MSNTNKVVQLSAARAGKLADEAGALQVQINALTKRLDAIKDELKANGEAEYIGRAYRVVVSSMERTTLDYKLVQQLLTPAEVMAASKTVLITSAVIKVA